MIRNIANPKTANTQVWFPFGATNKGIHVPTNSSMFTALGSLPQYLSITLEVQTPIAIVPIIKRLVTMVKTEVGKYKYNKYQMPRAAKAPADPSAIGINPVPKPVDSSTWNNGALPIL